MLAKMFEILITLRDEGVELDLEEVAEVDAVGVYLKTRLGVTSKGNRVGS